MHAITTTVSVCGIKRLLLDCEMLLINHCIRSIGLSSRCSIFWLAIIVGKNLQAQTQIKSYVKSNTVAINTINPDSTDFSELELIGNAIGDAKLVMLGEQDHGDAPSFLAKTRLIKYLHEKKGFNVLAFESDFFGLNYGFDRLSKTKADIDSFIRKNIFPVWTYCNTCQNLFYNYIPSTFNTDRPLNISGFDSQLLLKYSNSFLAKSLDSLFRALNLAIVKDEEYETVILPLIDSLRYAAFKDSSNYTRCATYLSRIKNELTRRINDQDFWMKVIDNLIQENKQYSLQEVDKIEMGKVRDHQMALNLQWLRNIKYPNEKIIVWAANLHIAKLQEVSKNGKNSMKSMGWYYSNLESNSDETYIIGFNSYEGKAGRLGREPYQIRKPQANGFETWIDKSVNYAFCDFKAYRKSFPNQSETFFLKALGHNTAYKKDWTEIFDGIFFIREMYPCTQ